ncbi:MAG: cell division protein FtsA [Rhodospirillales bacterium]|nr:cell division protein FtsA [Alphaproteobacteria bacterium]MCB9976381.1 cell division protein FtsA [Rhodospirillales bacterium]
MQKGKPKPKGSVLAALDVGSSKVACFIARVVDDGGTFEVLGVGHRPSQGVKNGIVVDLDEAESAIRQAVHAAENMAAAELRGYPLREVIANVSGVHIRSEGHSVDVQINGHDITDNDVLRALAHAQEHAATNEHELIHTIPTFFRVDGHDGIRDPRGMVGQSMQVDAHLVTGERGALRNLATSIERSHLDISACCVSSYAAGLACLVDDEIDLGCTVIDIGGGVTSFAVFHAGYMIHCDCVPAGGKHVTSDIARVLVTSVSDAERLKALYGSAIASHTDESDMIDVPALGENERSKPNLVPRALLIGIIQPRFEEIFEIIRQKLTDTGLGKIIGRRVVLTGGASQTPGLRDLAQHVLDKQVRLGRPIRLHGLPDAVSGPAFATAAGLLTYASEHTAEMPAEIMAQVRPESFVQRAKLWLKENW